MSDEKISAEWGVAFVNVKKNANKQLGHSFEIVTLQEMTKWDQFLSSWNTDFLWEKKNAV